MKIIIIRHGDPDYSIDSLTEKGWREAGLLAERLAETEMTEIYVSPMGRAQDTLRPTLEKTGRNAVTLEWLKEFWVSIRRSDISATTVWDWLPQEWTKETVFFDRNQWFTNPVIAETVVKEKYDWVIENFDKFLAEHGYVREGDCYCVEKANRDTLVFVCHFGIECVLLSRLMNVSPMVLWHSLNISPSAVTRLHTEERSKGIAAFRVDSIGDTSHLYKGGEEISSAGCFCEVYDNIGE